MKEIENRITKVEDSAYLDGTMSIDRAKGIIKQLGGKLADERKCFHSIIWKGNRFKVC